MKTVLMNPNIASVQTNAEGEKQVQNRLLSSSFFSWAGQLQSITVNSLNHTTEMR